jgi:hypothetical protein
LATIEQRTKERKADEEKKVEGEKKAAQMKFERGEGRGGCLIVSQGDRAID